VVLIHGSVSDLRIWRPIAPALARHYRVIAYSRRHHWPNPPPLDEYSYVRDVDDLVEVLRVLGISAAHLLAHSSGGYVAVEFAKRYPKKTTSLTLFDANARGILKEPEATAVSSELGKWLGPVRAFLAAGDDKAAMRCLLEPLAQGTKLPKRFASMVNENLDSLKRQFASTAPSPSINCAQFRRYPGPTLVLQGERSPHAFKTVNKAFRRCARNAQFTTIERCGHLFQVDAPAKVSERILQFLSTNSN
jgi:pimeloyl-ACP methyl ester carboxylesterase